MNAQFICYKFKNLIFFEPGVYCACNILFINLVNFDS